MRSVRIPYFRIWYSLAITALFLVTVALTLISPFDLVYQTVHGAAGPKANVISVAATYLGTFLACCFLWAARLYTNRAALAAIPKSYLPVTAADLPAKVRRLVVRNARRSALIAWDSRPRDVARELAPPPPDGPEPASSSSAAAPHHHYHLPHLHLHLHRRHGGGAGIIPAAAACRAWGPLAHAGWAPPRGGGGGGGAPSPTAPTAAAASPRAAAPAVRYANVVAELPHLLEAKAVSLAPPRPRARAPTAAAAAPAGSEGAGEGEGEEPEPDAALVALLRRPDRAGLRAYVAHLDALGLVPPGAPAAAFVRRYEDARFAGRAVTAREFGLLMEGFAALLGALRVPDGGVLDPYRVDDDAGGEAVGLGVGVGDGEDGGTGDGRGSSSDRYALSVSESDGGDGGSVRRLSRLAPGVDGSAYETSDFYSFGEDEPDNESLRAASHYETSTFHSIDSEDSSVIAFH
jgi:hypothetical protein